jgi:DNA-binding transcriptional LysR family regulator
VAYARRWAPGFYDSWIQMFTAAGFSPRVVQETGEMETMLALVAAGVGIAVAPQGLVRRQVRGLTVRALPRDAPYSEIGLAVRSGQNNVLTDRLAALALSLGKSAQV